MQHKASGEDLADLLHRIFNARRDLAVLRRGQTSNRSEVDQARHQLIEALEAYLACLAGSNSPIPYRLRDELRLNRRLDAPVSDPVVRGSTRRAQSR